MDATSFVDELFAGYAPNPELEDFKAEVLANLRERVADLESGGATPAAALARATEELGDISEIAAQMSTRRAQDVFASMYLHHKVRPDTAHLLGYIICGALLAAGIALTLVGFLVPSTTAVLALAAIGLVALPIGAVTAIGLTQETTTNLPMRTGRAIGYGVAVFLILAGLALAGVLLWHFADVQGAGQAKTLGVATRVVLPWRSADLWGAVLGACLPLVIAGAGLATYLGVTQTSRKKPWVRRREQEWAAHRPGGGMDVSEARWARFGLYVVGLWVLAVAVFFILGFAIGFQFAWITFIVAVAAMFALIAWAMKGDK